MNHAMLAVNTAQFSGMTGSLKFDDRGYFSFSIGWNAARNRIYVGSKRYTRKQARKRFGIKITARSLRVGWEAFR